MRHLIVRGFTSLLCLLCMFGLFAVPAASAQITETSEVLSSGETMVTNKLVTLGGNRTVVTETLIAADGCSSEITTTVTEVLTDTEPSEPVGEYENRGGSTPLEPLPLVETVTTANAELVCSPPLTDEVLGEVETPGLAVTGSNVDTPLVIGAALVGVGGLLVAASKRRSEDDS